MNKNNVSKHEERRHINLKVYSRFTKGETVMSPENVIDFAYLDRNHAIALTDFNSVRGYYEFYNAAKKYRDYGIKPIFGLSTYCLFGTGKKKEITLLAKSQKGLKNIYKLVSVSQMRKEALDKEPYLTIDEVEKYREGIIVGMAFGWDVIYYNLYADMEGASTDNSKGSAEDYYNALFGEYLCCVDYAEISPWEHRNHCAGAAKGTDEEKLKQAARSLVSYLQDKGKHPVATTGGNCYGFMDDVCFEVLHSDDTVTKHPLSYLKCTERVLQDYEFLGEELAEKLVLDNPSYISDMIEVITLPEANSQEHKFEMPGAKELFIKKCNEAVLDKYGDDLPKLIRERIDDEIKKIYHGKWESFYIVSAEIIKKCRELGGTSKSRGLLGSSFVAYLLGITETNPLPPHYYCLNCKHVEFVDEEVYYSGYDLIGYGKEKCTCPKCGATLRGDGHNIPCETLFGPDGEKTIGFEFDFSDEYIGELQACLKKLLGEDRVYNLNFSEKNLGPSKAAEMVDAYCQKTGVDFGYLEKEIVIDAISAMCDGEYKKESPINRMFFVPEGKDVYDYAPVGYRKISGTLNDEPVLIQVHPYELAMEHFTLDGGFRLPKLGMMEKYSGVSAQSIDWSEVDFSKLFSECREYEDPILKAISQITMQVPLTSFTDLVKQLGKWHHRTMLQDSDGTGADDMSNDIIAVREDIWFTLKKYGLTDAASFEIMEVVRKGKAVNGFSDEHMKLLKTVPDRYIESMKKIKYLFPKDYVVEEARVSAQIAWYKMNYPKAYWRSI